MAEQNRDQLTTEIKEELIIRRLRLEDIEPEEIDDQEPLFGDGLGLDSVEAFEIIVGLEQMYGIKVQDIPADELREHLYSVDTIARFIQEEAKKNAS